MGDDEDEDDGFFVPHGYLSEDEGVTEVRGERGGDCPGESSPSRAEPGCECGAVTAVRRPSSPPSSHARFATPAHSHLWGLGPELEFCLGRLVGFYRGRGES